MKLRHRFAVTFALASLGMLVTTRLVTTESFMRLQEYQLDRGLRARALEAAADVPRQGHRALEHEPDEGQERDETKPDEGPAEAPAEPPTKETADEETDPLEQLVTYGALYRADGTLVADTKSFAHAPALHEVGSPTMRAPGSCFDFRFRGKLLRGVIAEIPSAGPAEPRYLLLAASRRELDDDARELLAVGWWVVVASLPIALALGWWLGRRMTLGVERLAEAAGRVTAGELDLETARGVTNDEEVAALGKALREMVERLRTLIETERRFASHAAHELRSPLAALRGQLELALRRKRSVDEYEAAVGEALDDTNRLVALAEDLLVIARIDSGAIEARDDECEVDDLVREAVSVSAARTGVSVTVDSDSAASPVVRGAQVALVRLIRNLIDNAAFHGGGGPVRVKLRTETSATDGAWALIEIEDDGPGVAPEDRDRIFEPFHRGADARQESGAGLGLGIAREVARRHGGDVVMDSPQKPTRFIVKLPAHARRTDV